MKYIHNFFQYTSFLGFLFLASIGSAFAADETEIIFMYCENTCQEISESQLQSSFPTGSTIPLQILIKNPTKTDVYSVQSWIKFNASIFEVTDLDDKNTEFELAAPGEFKADNEKGEIRIGRAVAGIPIKSEHIVIGDVKLKVKKNPNNATLEFIDGKTGVMTIDKNVPTNLLSNLPEKLTFKNVKPASSSTSTSTPKATPTQQHGQNIYGTTNPNAGSSSGNTTNDTGESVSFSADLPRPQGFRSRTYEDGRVEHLWKAGDDSRIKGYYLYYSLNSGTYMHRKDLGRSNKYKFPADFFEKGQRVYFSVQAYTSEGKLSDFSDETYVTTGTEGSESHPFFEQIFPDAESTGEDETNKYYGPNPNSADMTGGVGGGSTTEKTSYPTPKNNTQSGPMLNSSLYLILGGILMIFAARVMRMNRRMKNVYREQLGYLLPGIVGMNAR